MVHVFAEMIFSLVACAALALCALILSEGREKIAQALGLAAPPACRMPVTVRRVRRVEVAQPPPLRSRAAA